MDNEIKKCSLLMVDEESPSIKRVLKGTNLVPDGYSFIVNDPGGEIYKTVGEQLKNDGYEVKVLNLIDMDKSRRYSPFKYICDEQDVITMVDSLIFSTTPYIDPGLHKAETALLQALCFFLISECFEYDRNFLSVMKLLRCAEVKEGDEKYGSTLDILFNDLAEKDPEHIAVRKYKEFKQETGKYFMGICVSCCVRLAMFNINAFHNLTNSDDIDLKSFSDRKTAIFCIVPTNDTSLYFLTQMMYTQLFEEVYKKAKEESLTVPVRFILDQFINLFAVPNLSEKLNELKELNISCAFHDSIWQIAKCSTEGYYETIIDNCSAVIFNGQDSGDKYEFLFKLLENKETEILKSSRKNGNLYEALGKGIEGRALLTPEEKQIIDNNNCIFVITP